MKLFVSLYMFSILAIDCRAQSTSQNFTKTDCNNVTHTLFNYLDEGKIVVIEFGMGCSTCITAGQNLSNVNFYYTANNPGKVIFLYMDYQVTNCNQINNFINLNNINFPGIPGCAIEKNYYFNTSPMPGVIVTGGAAHTVYFSDSDYVAIDSVAIMNAINTAITDPAGISSKELDKMISIYPNPTVDYLRVENISCDTINEVNITNQLGETVLIFLNPNTDSLINLEDLPKGIYTVNILIGANRINKKLIVI